MAPGLPEGRQRARELMYEYNVSRPTMDGNERRKILAKLLCVPVESLAGVMIEPPLYVDYGSNIKLKGEFYANFNTTILDCAVVTIGKRVLFGPNVSLYPATHGISVKERQSGLERANEIEIGDDCWIGGGANIQAGVKLGQGCTVGAGAVVTKSFPDWYVRPDALQKIGLDLFMQECYRGQPSATH
ncbi:trimeric LpxA-like protein [Cylindrobasidium torrendii FP15055 ss-10]|uniref:Trimeric LpxA-like protein n=1 Tax=Cylindrobasidium torrendii FP15055 ss-10 TaxID=1314674 RepID=A0A0D7BJX9_9AGAR|nr:trimeric LpxA-like protein [Cylindrobasidium torrendii FP15055 ss-10]